MMQDLTMKRESSRPSDVHHDERSRRWRLILGEQQGEAATLSALDQQVDQCLATLYGDSNNPSLLNQRSAVNRRGESGTSLPAISRWLGDIRDYFPSPIAQVMQRDAIEVLGLEALLMEPDLFAHIEPDIHLVAQLISLKNVIPTQTKASARLVVAKLVDELKRRLEAPTREAITGSINRARHHTRPRHNEIDWRRTIMANLKHYQADYQGLIPERRIGYGRKRSSLKDIILCVDQSGSMATSVVYSSIFAGVLASLSAVSTKLVIFDTSVVDLSEEIHNDPVDLLFGLNLGGGTDINQALAYCESLITRPTDTILVVISDLMEGGDERKMLARMKSLIDAGVNCITLLALSDEGAPWFDAKNTAHFSALGVPCFACTPELFPELMASAINQCDLFSWVSRRDLTLIRGDEVR